MEEVWKAIEGYEGIYEVSSLGRVRSIDRDIYQVGRWGKVMKVRQPGKMIAQHANNGYKRVALYRDGQGKWSFVHRLVATAFVPNPDDKPYINHKDENRSNNVPENLEWCTMAENNLYGGHVERTQSANIANRQAIEQVDASGNVVATFESITSAAHQTGIPISSVSQCLSGKLRQTHGFTFRIHQPSQPSKPPTALR